MKQYAAKTVALKHWRSREALVEKELKHVELSTSRRRCQHCIGQHSSQFQGDWKQNVASCIHSKCQSVAFENSLCIRSTPSPLPRGVPSASHGPVPCVWSAENQTLRT